MADRVIELDENFYYAGAHLFKAIVYATLPPMLGGNVEKSKNHLRNVLSLMTEISSRVLLFYENVLC